MTLVLDNFAIPEQGLVEVNVKLSFEIKVTAEEARRKVNSWVLSYLVLTEPPTLALGKRPVWRVPAVLTYPSLGNVGTIGVVDVDVETGEMNPTPELKAQMEEW